MSLLKIGILGHVGNQNLGDEALISAVIQNVRRRDPSASLCAFTLNPPDTSSRHGIPAWPLRKRAIGTSPAQPDAAGSRPASSSTSDRLRRFGKSLPVAGPILRSARAAVHMLAGIFAECRFWCESYGRMRGLDLLIVAGSQQLNDFVSGPWAFPYTILKWSFFARLRRTRVVFLSVGAGPISSALGRWFIRKSLSWADYRSYRDPRSLMLVQEIGVSGENLLVPDLVFSHEIPDCMPDRSGSTTPLVVGINPLPFFHPDYWFAADPAAYDRYIGMLAKFADFLVDAGHTVSFFPTQLKVDPGVISDVRRAMKNSSNRVIEPTVRTFEDLAAAIRATDMVVATRYHGILISLLLQKPVLALAYHGKSRDLMELIGFPEYAVDVEDCAAAGLLNTFHSLLSRRYEVENEIAKRLPVIQREVAEQYDRVLPLMLGITAATALTPKQAT